MAATDFVAPRINPKLLKAQRLRKISTNEPTWNEHRLKIVPRKFHRLGETIWRGAC
jgi:hypothetical protein